MGPEEHGLRVSYIDPVKERRKRGREGGKEGEREGEKAHLSILKEGVGMTTTVFSIESSKSDLFQLTRSFLPCVWMSCPVKILSPS